LGVVGAPPQVPPEQLGKLQLELQLGIWQVEQLGAPQFWRHAGWTHPEVQLGIWQSETQSGIRQLLVHPAWLQWETQLPPPPPPQLDVQLLCVQLATQSSLVLGGVPVQGPGITVTALSIVVEVPSGLVTVMSCLSPSTPPSGRLAKKATICPVPVTVTVVARFRPM
jgi:hypothetical protein